MTPVFDPDARPRTPSYEERLTLTVLRMVYSWSLSAKDLEALQTRIALEIAGIEEEQ